VHAPEVAERDGAVARGVVLTEELLGGADETVLLGLYEDRPRRPCQRRIGHHTVLHALQHPIGHNLQRPIQKKKKKRNKETKPDELDEQFHEAATKISKGG
jgi:hypothetical protein